MDEVERLEANLPATNDQKLATVLNAFAAQTVMMLNRVSSAAEGKLARAEARLRDAETSTRLLEASLGASPPPPTTTTTTMGDARTQSESVVSASHAVAAATTPQVMQHTESTGDEGDEDARAAPEAPEEREQPATEQPETNAMTNDPVYGKYFKMIKMGVPTQAVRNKMTLDGVDASVLDGHV